MNLTVLHKIILGFAIISAMLLVSNVVSYLGLNEISYSARNVVEEKMPIQAKMLQVQTGLLSLAKESTTGFFLQDLATLTNNNKNFSLLVRQTKQQFDALSANMSANDTSYLQGKKRAYAYLDFAQNMYSSRSQQLSIEQ
ncbi:MAG: hypothetical protein NWQ54_15695, partial [Paraglaciecola sp.]|nr:hypothetical protein [Paraglaciecola sp.]